MTAYFIRWWVVLLVSSSVACAQVPSFKSFDTNQFTTNNFIIRVNDGASFTNITNSRTSPSSPNDVATFGDLLWTNKVNVLQPTAGTSVLVTNLLSQTLLSALGAFTMPASATTNLVTGTNCVNPYNLGSIWMTGPTTTPADTTVSLVSGNGQGQLLILQNYATNSAFTMLNGVPFCDGAPGAYIRLNGDWVSTNRGDALFLYNTGQIWTEIGRASGNTNAVSGDNVWANTAGVIHPVNGNTNNVLTFTSGLADNATNVALRVNTTNSWNPAARLLSLGHFNTNYLSVTPSGGIIAGPNAVAISGNNITEQDRFFSGFLDAFTGDFTRINLKQSSDTASTDFSNVQLATGFGNGDNDERFALLDIITIENANNTYRHWGLSSGSGIFSSEFLFEDEVDRRLVFSPAITSSGSAVAYLFDTSNVLTNGDTFVSIRNAGTELLGIGPQTAASGARMVWGPGNTNVFFRRGDNLAYTNAVNVENYFALIDGAGREARIGTAGNTARVSGGNTVEFEDRNSSTYLRWTNNRLWPAANAAILGGDYNSVPETPFSFLNLDSNYFHYGYHDGTNFSRLNVSHTGTNGVISFASEVLGAPVGVPRDFQFSSNATEVATFTVTGGLRLPLATAYLAANATSTDATLGALGLQATVASGKKYSFKLVLFCANSVAADGVKIDFDGGSAAATNFRAHAVGHETALFLSQQVSALATDITAAVMTGDSEIVVNGSFEPSGSGTFIPRFAENVDGGGTLTVYRGSNLILTEIP